VYIGCNHAPAVSSSNRPAPTAISPLSLHDALPISLESETDAASRDRLERLRAELADGKERLAELTARWQNEKTAIEGVQKVKEELDALRTESEKAERDGDYARVAEIDRKSVV